MDIPDILRAMPRASTPLALALLSMRDVADPRVRTVSAVADGRHARIPAGTLPNGQQ
jgi:hypothetical protein